MIRALAALAALVLVLGLLDAWLAGRESRARDEEHRVGALFTKDEAENLRKQPAFRIELAGESHAYGRIEGQWRCLSYHKAPADARAVQSLLDGVVQAEGIVHASSSEEAPAFGINTPRTLRLSIQGPRAMQDRSGDVLATLEIGLAQTEREGCFVRKKGTPEIWSISSDLRAPIEHRLAPGLPPLLEPSAVPSAWLEGGGAVRVTLARGASRTVIEQRQRELDPATMQPGMMPWVWVVKGDTPEHDVTLDDSVAGAFTGFLERLPYVAVLDSDAKAALLAASQSSVTLQPRNGRCSCLPSARARREAGGAVGRGERHALRVSAPNFRLARLELLTVKRGEKEEPLSAALHAVDGASSPPGFGMPAGFRRPGRSAMVPGWRKGSGAGAPGLVLLPRRGALRIKRARHARQRPFQLRGFACAPRAVAWKRRAAAGRLRGGERLRPPRGGGERLDRLGPRPRDAAGERRDRARRLRRRALPGSVDRHALRARLHGHDGRTRRCARRLRRALRLRRAAPAAAAAPNTQGPPAGALGRLGREARALVLALPRRAHRCTRSAALDEGGAELELRLRRVHATDLKRNHDAAATHARPPEPARRRRQACRPGRPPRRGRSTAIPPRRRAATAAKLRSACPRRGSRSRPARAVRAPRPSATASTTATACSTTTCRRS